MLAFRGVGRTFGDMRRFLVFATLTGLSACRPAAPDRVAPDPETLTREIRLLLAEAATAWNRGDLDGFVSTYAAEPTTTFVSGGQVRHGFDWIRANYAPGFTPDARRDSLRFEGLETRPPGREHALATAHYVLFQGDSTTDTGIFTLVLRLEGDRWVMIHDHTSR